MTNSTRLRVGVLAAAAATLAGSLLAAAPANAATGTIELAKTAYTAGDWGTGLDVTGSGFTPDAVVTITVSDDTPTPVDSHTVTADAAGAFHEVYVPGSVLALQPFATLTVSATSDQGDTSNTVQIAVLLPKSIVTDSPSITTEDLKDSTKGVTVAASGYTPGETVTVTVEYAGSTQSGGTYEADAAGAVAFRLWLESGSSVAGQLVITAAGSASGVTQSITVEVTGETIDGGVDGEIEEAPVIDGTEAPAAPAAPTGAKNLPVVSG